MKTNSTFLFIWAVFCSGLITVKSKAQSCLPGGITFTTQAQIDNFATNYPGCTEILGPVVINDAVNGNITNLNGLMQLVRVGGLSIVNNSALINLSGLNSLDSVKGNFYLTSNALLSDITALSSLTAIYINITSGSSGGITLSISSNPSLINLNGLESLNSITYDIYFWPNTQLGGISITSNSSLTSLSGLEGITSLSSLTIQSNNSLSSLSGLDNIVDLAILSIENNNSLSSLIGLSGLTSVSQFNITGNNSLTSLDGISSLNNIGSSISIYDNDALTSISGLSGINGDLLQLHITDNDALTNLSGLEGITWIGSFGGGLTISENEALTNLSGLNNVTQVGHPIFPSGASITISNNPSLINITALSLIENVYGSVGLTNNDALTTLDGLENINPSSIKNLILTNSSLLSVCDLPNLCTYLSAPCNLATISANSSGCATRGEVESNCGISQSVYIITQPQSQSVNNCSPATFSVVAGGPPPFTYKWYKNGNLISGATASTYTTPPLTNSYNGAYYHCIVTNCGGNQVTSNSAILTVLGSCVQTYPSISLNSSTLVFPQNLIIQGSNFTPYGLVEISISYEDGNSISTNYPIDYSIPGQFQFTLPILQSFKKGKYTIQVKDLSTGNYAPTKIFQVNNVQALQRLEILSPSPYEIFYVGDLFNITWKDYITSGPPIGQSGFVLKEYKLEITNNNGATWSQIQNHAESAEINSHKTFNINYNTYGPGNFKIRITDWDNPLNTETTQTFQVSGCTTSDFKPTLEWDASIPTQSTYKNPIGLATDGTARLLVKLKRQTNKAVSSIQATIVPIGDNFNTPQLLGKIMYATNHATYSVEANAANSITTTKTFTTDGNKPEYYFWLVAPDDFTTDINSEAEYRKISINLTITYADNSTEGLTLCKPIYLYRPPVVFVHGIFGDPTTFESTYYLNNSGSQSKFDPSFIWKVTKRLDLNAIGPYQTNSDILLERTLDEHNSTENSLINPLIKMHNLGFACKRVDYIAHSMGGAVGRNTINFNDPYYSPGMKYKNYSKGYINKLITICTPHNGSYVADFIIDRLNDGYNILSETIWDYWDLESDLIKYGLPSNAAYDLQAYDGGVILPLTTVKNHLIGADIDQNNALSESTLVSAINYGPLKWAYKILTPPSTTIHDYMSNNYNNSEYLQQTDLVVSISSQLAGSLPTSAININANPAGIGSKSIIYGLNKQHVGIAEDLIIGTRLKKLLNAPMSSGFFANEISPNTTGQFTNDHYISRSVLTEDSTQFHFDTSYIVIVNPDTNSVYFVDSTMEISLYIKDTFNLLRLQILFQNELFESYAKDSIQLFITDVHSKYLGTNTVFAIAAYDSLGYTVNHIDTVQVVVQSSTASNDFYVTPNEINLNPNEVLNPKYYLVFPNFVGHIKPNNDSITYAIADTNVIVYDSIHFNFIAKDTGSTYIIYYYENYSDTTFVYITERLKNNVINICSTSDLSLFAGSNDSLKTYQWQVKELNEFSNISDNMNYQGTDSSTLLINNPPSEWYNNEYRCIISDLIGSTVSDVYTIRFLNTWNGSVDSLWENPLNWSCNAVPDCNTDVSIPSNLERYPFINSQAFCRTIKLDSASSTNIKPGFELWVGKTNATIVCPDDIVVNLSPGECEMAINYSISEVGESCNVILIQNSGLPSGDIFPIGATTNCFTYVDQNGSPVASCCFDVTVIEYPTPTSTLACNDNIQVSMGPNCDAFISADMLLEGGPYSCYNDYLVSVDGYDSGLGGVTVTSSAIGQTLTATVTDPSSGNSCTGTVSIEDQIPPEATCSNFQVPCGQSIEPDSSTTPIILDNCGILELNYTDTEDTGPCPGFSIIIRHWVVTDNSGNTDTCDQVISFLPASLDSVSCPPTYVGSCGGYNSPGTTGYPIYNGVQIEEGGLCNLFAFYSDQDTILEGYFTVIRTWRIVDTCASLEIECIQNIVSTDNEDPILTCPNDYETSCIQSTAPEIAGFPTYSDNCNSTLSYIDSAISGDPCESQIFSRTWTVLDNSNNSATCIQYFTLLPVSLDSLNCPSSYIGSCGDNSDPLATGYPSIDGYPINVNGPCNIFYGYSDQDSITCEGAFISRTWTISDWCTQDTSVCIQNIDLLNNTGQILACPEDIFISIEVGESNVPVSYYVSSACNCGDTIIQTAGLASGDSFPIGSTTNCFVLLDSLGSTIDSCCFDIVVYVHCLQGGIIFTTQAEIDSFPINYPGCTTIEGNVTIDDGGSGNITNLTGLNQLTHISGDLNILNNANLITLEELIGISEIGGYLNITSNLNLNSLNGLDSLVNIGGGLYIQDNPELPTISNLSQVATIGAGVIIYANPSLSNLNGLNTLTTIIGGLSISANINLTSLFGLELITNINGGLSINNNNIINLTGLESLVSVSGNLDISGNNSLTSLTGIDQLESISGSLLISSNPNLADLSSLQELNFIGYVIQISNNSSLTNLVGLNQLSSVGSYAPLSADNIIQNNLNLIDLVGLNALTYISGSLHIKDNPLLQNLEGLDNINAISGSLSVENNNILTNLTGLNSLSSVGTGLYIQGNTTLLNLNGLDSLAIIGGPLLLQNNIGLVNLEGINNLNDIGGDLYLSSNSSLSNLIGLDSLQNIGGELFIQNNSILSECDVQSICDYLNIPSNPATISGNATGCASRSEVEAACVISNCPQGNIEFIAQVGIDSFPINYPSCDTIFGDVIIQGPDITNLNGLSNIKVIQGYLTISNNTALSSLAGLDSLKTVYDLYIYDNPDLLTLNHLDSLHIIGDWLQVSNNDALYNLVGLGSVDSIINLEISNNSNLEALTGLYITQLNNLNIAGNVALTNLDGFASVSTIGALQIIYNDSLTNLLGLDSIEILSSLNLFENPLLEVCNVQSICDFVEVPSNSMNIYSNATGCNNVAQIQVSCSLPITCPGNITLISQMEIDSFNVYYSDCDTIFGNVVIQGSDITNLYGLSNIKAIQGYLTISNNTILTSLAGLDSLASVYELYINDNSSLQDLNNLNSLSNIEDWLQISNNDLLLNLDGLDQIDTVINFEIANNMSLEDLSGLTELISINSLNIANNSSLSNISSLPNLESVGSLSIYNNDILSSLSGLDSINILNNLVIDGNDLLSICDVQSICDYLDIPTNPASISGNATGCATRMEVEDECGN